MCKRTCESAILVASVSVLMFHGPFKGGTYGATWRIACSGLRAESPPPPVVPCKRRTFVRMSRQSCCFGHRKKPHNPGAQSPRPICGPNARILDRARSRRLRSLAVKRKSEFRMHPPAQPTILHRHSQAVTRCQCSQGIEDRH